MEYIQLTKLVEDGEYEAILREMRVWPTCFPKDTIGWEQYGDSPVCRVTLYFEIVDGAPDRSDPRNWLDCTEHWPAADSALDRMVAMVEGLVPRVQQSSPCITSLPLGQCFSVRVEKNVQVGGGEVIEYCTVTEILGLAEPALAR